MRPWAFRRRVEYLTLAFFVFVFPFLVQQWVNRAAPTCFDNNQNGGESGVDCGGSCARICQADIREPTTVWVRAFRIRDGQYNALAYVENRNLTAGAPTLQYTFSLHDKDGLIVSRDGTTVLPPDGEFPIFEGRLMTGERVPTQAKFEIKPDQVWVRAEPNRQQFRVESREIKHADASPILNASLTNTDIEEVQDVEVVATIFDARGVAVTASQTFMKYFPGRTTQNIVFTWPAPIAKTVRTCEVPSDIMIVLDRSGSMAGDGGVPPEPLESAKKAAQAFVNQLQPNDRIGYVSYATVPSTPLEQVLTNDKQSVVRSIARTAMGTDGTQYTNMGDAFKAAFVELGSERHRGDARKVIVFLTDGDVTRPINPATNRADREYAAEYARAAAAAAKAADVTVYTIGFGDAFQDGAGDIQRDEALIRDLATSPEHYFRAPDIAQLNAAYQSIAKTICETGPAVIEIIPKSKAGFAPGQ